ncbi:GDSL-type esterase/lipase family protein [Qipengyuania sp.]|uniref:GDSL-type esterase/lipase family protein n=1 Tax=Qipengyuania sp. TaxID=2004515 RepID=UPI003BADA620
MTAPTVSQEALDTYIELRQKRIADIWRAFAPPKGAVVFAGSSIVEEGPFNEMFPDYTVINRGIGADTTTGLLNRLDEIIALKPAKLFVYIGGNDRSRLNDNPEAAIGRLSTIVDRLRTETPETEVYVHTLFPREVEHAAWIEEFNRSLRWLGRQGSISVIDTHPLVLGENGAIDPALTNDGIHLLSEGYRRWQTLLQQGRLPPVGERDAEATKQ